MGQCNDKILNASLKPLCQSSCNEYIISVSRLVSYWCVDGADGTAAS